MARYFLEVSYDGIHFHGSQLQGITPTVQLAINKALSTLLRTQIISFGASRTDEGVHALCNYYHFDINVQLQAAFQYNLNAILPHGLAIKNIYKTDNPEANARFDAISRQYRYKIYTKKDPFLFKRALFYPFRIDMDILAETAAVLKTYQDFETFSKRNTQTYTFKCNIFQSYWEQAGDETHYVVNANRFLRGMVRGLVGTQLNIARGKGRISDFQQIIESKDCTKANFSVAGYGLYLEEISYPTGLLIAL